MSKRICSIDDCGRAFRARGLCSTHYEQLRRSAEWQRSYQKRPPFCVINKCTKPVHGRSLCLMHYRRSLRGQSMDTPSRFERPVADRFWEKVDATGDCWEWLGSRHSKGYGWFRMGSQMKKAHRVAWVLLIGPIPDGLTLDHLCLNPPCVNPDHLEPVTAAENTRRALKGRRTERT